MRAMIALLVGGFVVAQFAAPRAWREVAREKTAAAPHRSVIDYRSAQRANYDPDLANVTVLNRAPNGHFLAKADVNLAPVTFLVDTGATTIALTEADARRANIAFDPAAFTMIGQGAAGPVYGAPVTIEAITIDGRPARGLSGVVMKGATMSLLGQSFLQRYARVEISGDRMLLR